MTPPRHNQVKRASQQLDVAVDDVCHPLAVEQLLFLGDLWERLGIKCTELFIGSVMNLYPSVEQR